MEYRLWNRDWMVNFILFLSLEQYVTNLGLDLYYYCYFFIHIIVMAGDFHAVWESAWCMFLCAGQVKELWMRWRICILIFFVFVICFIYSSIIEWEYVRVISWLSLMNDSLMEFYTVSTRSRSQAELLCVFCCCIPHAENDHETSVSMRVSVLKSCLHPCPKVRTFSLNEEKGLLFFLKINNAPFASCNVMYI